MDKKNEKKGKLPNSLYWVVCVAIIAVFPLFLMFTYKWLRGDNLTSLICEHFPDFLMVIAALASGIYYEISNEGGHRWQLLFTVMTMLFCYPTYFYIYFLNSTDRAKVDSHLVWLLCVSFALYLGAIALGFFRVWNSAKSMD